MHHLELTRDLVQTIHWVSTPAPAPAESPATSAAPFNSANVVHGDTAAQHPAINVADHVLRLHSATNCVLIARPIHTTAHAAAACSSSAGEALRRSASAMLGLNDAAVAVVMSTGNKSDETEIASIAATAAAASEGGEGVVLLGFGGVVVVAPSVAVAFATLLDLER